MPDQLDFLDDVAGYLHDAGIGSFKGTDAQRNIFVNELPDGPEACIALLGKEGYTLPESKNVRSLIFPRFQVVCRSPDYAWASAKHYAVRNTIHAIYGVALPNWRILACHAEQEGGPIGKDEQGRQEFSCNYLAEANAETAA